MDVQQSQRVSTPFTEFDIVGNEHVLDSVEFDADTVDFCFWAPFSSAGGKLICYVRLSDAETEEFLYNGQAELSIEADDDDRHYLSFSGFGYLDAEMTTRVGACKYEVWLDGTERARVTVFV